MQCPTDHTELATNERNGVNVASCSECGGVWLAQGMLEKLVEAATSMSLHPDHFQQGRSGYDLLPSYDRNSHPDHPAQDLGPLNARRSFFTAI